jgi:hypothetical protein
MSAQVVVVDELDFVDQVKHMDDPSLLALHGFLAKQRLKTVLGNSFVEDKEAETELYLSYNEIERRIKNNNWHPVKPRIKRTFR